MNNPLTLLLNEKIQERFNGNASEFAREVGTSQQNISNWLSGEVLKPSYWKKAAQLLAIPEEELKILMEDARLAAGPDGKGSWHTDPIPGFTKVRNRYGSHTTVHSKPSMQLPPPVQPYAIVPPNATVMPTNQVVTTNKMLPVLGEAVGGVDGKYIFNGSIIDYVVCPPSLENVAGAYAVYIDGESMYPRYKSGETAWVHPTKPARRGDDVIVQIHPPEDDGSPPWGYVKEFQGWAGNKLILGQYNPPGPIEFDREKVVSIHPIVLSGKY